MLSSDLLVSLCETDAEENKFVVRNQNGSLNRQMFEFYMGSHALRSGEPQEGAVYLIVDALLDGLKPDLIYTFKGENCESTFLGYKIDDAPLSV